MTETKAETPKAKTTAIGIDPEKGERVSVTYRQLFNEMGDATKAAAAFRDIALAGGYGDVSLDQTLDISGLARSVKENNEPRADVVEDAFSQQSAESVKQEQEKTLKSLNAALKTHGVK